MNYEFSEIRFPSSDGINTVYGEIYTPIGNQPIKAVVQIAHGMIDYVGRYKALADYLAREGIAFAGNHHLGHGKSVKDDEDFGYFAKKDGVSLVLSDMSRMNKEIKERFPSAPIILMGHSMGSFLARLYAVKYPHTLDGVIIHGSAGPNPAVPLGKAVARTVKLFKGERHRSRFLKSLVLGAYNKKFPKSEGENAWLTREVSLVADRASDKYTSFDFTASAYLDLFDMLSKCNSKEWYKKYPKDMKTLIMSGDMDPVGNYGKGPEYVYRHLLVAGASNLSEKSYKGARHELFNETNRDEVFNDLASWIKSTL